MPEQEEHQHIRTSTDEEEEPQQRGPLATILDPLGKGLGTALRPVGAGVEVLTKPVRDGVGDITRPALGPAVGTKEEKAEVLGGNNKDSYAHGKDSLGGQVQTADNPLGLDQTGRWGFEEESGK
jgi:hypothetical protein